MATTTPVQFKFQGTVTGCNPKTEHSPIRYTITCPQFANAELVLFQPVAVLQPAFRINDAVEITIAAAVPALVAAPASAPAPVTTPAPTPVPPKAA